MQVRVFPASNEAEVEEGPALKRARPSSCTPPPSPSSFPSHAHKKRTRVQMEGEDPREEEEERPATKLARKEKGREEGLCLDPSTSSNPIAAAVRATYNAFNHFLGLLHLTRPRLIRSTSLEHTDELASSILYPSIDTH